MIKKSRKRKEKKIALLAIKSKVTFLSFLLLCVCLLVVNGAYFIIFGGISMTISHQSQWTWREKRYFSCFSRNHNGNDTNFKGQRLVLLATFIAYCCCFCCWCMGMYRLVFDEPRKHFSLFSQFFLVAAVSSFEFR